jgi:uncharacterized protein YggE
MDATAMRNLLLTVLFSAATPLWGFADQTLTAVGTGVVTAHPDAAEIRLEVATRAAAAAAARTSNNTTTEQLVRRLGELGIPKKDVQTYRKGTVPLYLQHISDVQQREVVGYKLTNEVRVKVRDLQLLDKVLDDISAQGPSLVQDVRYLVDKPKGPWDEASRKAVADARRKAEQMAKEAGVELGEVLTVEQLQPEKASGYGADRKQPSDVGYSSSPSSQREQRDSSADYKKPTEESYMDSATDDYECRVQVAVTYAIGPHRKKIETKSPPGR